MSEKYYYVLGVMSGTSVDGIDFAYVRFTSYQTWQFEILKSETVAYTAEWQKRLRGAIQYGKSQLKELDTDYTEFLAQTAISFIKANNIKKLDAISSHGHTILHQPEEGFTYQIGNNSILAEKTGYKVICDFRVQDVKLGGQGAPLVPIGDRLLFSEYDLCINIGGFANVSFEKNNNRIAYDICPTNIVLNHYASLIGYPFDRDGDMAKRYKPDLDLLKKLNALTFYQQVPPKSLGIEWVQQSIFPLLTSSGLSEKIIIATFTEHMAQQIAGSILQHGKKERQRVLVTGGGAYNKHLISRIEHLAKIKLCLPNDEIIEFKEALIFGLMGVLRMRNEVNVLSSVTGAVQDHCSGVVFFP